MNEFYCDYSEYMKRIFPDFKVQKLSVNAGFSCPNRDGTIGTGGCIYCNNTSFTPGYCFGTESVRQQLVEGKKFFSYKYPDMNYLAYLQSFTNTHGRSVEELSDLYEEALSVSGVVGLIVGTRPDTLPPDVIELLGKIGRKVPVFVEIGAETSHDRTLRLINRGHTWGAVEKAVRECSAVGLRVGMHFICGLPQEGSEEVLQTVERAVSLPVESLKFHQLQVIAGTPLCEMWQRGEISLDLFDTEAYLELCCKIIERVPRSICIERFLASSPSDMVVAPKWGIKNYIFTHRLLNRLRKNCL